MNDKRAAVAQAAVQLLGSILQYDVAANTINLAIALDPRRQQTLGKSLRAKITMELKSAEYASLRRADQEAVLEAVVSTFKGVKINESLVRLSKDSYLLKEYVIGLNPYERAAQSKDPVTLPCYDAIMQKVSDFIATEIKKDQRHTQTRLDEAVKDTRLLADGAKAQKPRFAV